MGAATNPAPARPPASMQAGSVQAGAGSAVVTIHCGGGPAMQLLAATAAGTLLHLDTQRGRAAVLMRSHLPAAAPPASGGAVSSFWSSGSEVTAVLLCDVGGGQGGAGRLVLSAALDGALRLWSPALGAELFSSGSCQNSALCIAAPPGGSGGAPPDRVVVGCGDGSLKFFDLVLSSAFAFFSVLMP